MFLIQKYTQYKAAQAEQQKRKVTEKELAQLNHKIDKLLTKLDEHEPEIADSQDDECVVCVNAKATMQTYPCGHRVVCRKCFVKTIQMAVAQRLLPLRCVLCRAKILRLKHSGGGTMETSASQYTIGSHWYSVPQSASLYSVTSSTSGVSGVSGVSSASSCSSASSYKTCASSFSSASLKKRSYSKQGYQPLRTSSPSPSRSSQNRSGISISKKDHHRVVPVETTPPINTTPPKGKLTLIQEFQREFRNGKTKTETQNQRKGSAGSQKGGSTRIKCARLLVQQSQCCNNNNPQSLGDGAKVTLESSSSSSGGNGNGTRRVELRRSSSSASGTAATTTSTGSTGPNVPPCGNRNPSGFSRRGNPPPSSQSCHSFRMSRRDSANSNGSGYGGLKRGKLDSLPEIDFDCNSESDAKIEQSVTLCSAIDETKEVEKVDGILASSSAMALSLATPITPNIPPPQAKKLSSNMQ